VNLPLIIAVTWIGREYRFFGLTGVISSFWYWSIAGSVVMCVCCVFKRDPVSILAYLPNSMIYIRNLTLKKSISLAKELTKLAERARLILQVGRWLFSNVPQLSV